MVVELLVDILLLDHQSSHGDPFPFVVVEQYTVFGVETWGSGDGTVACVVDVVAFDSLFVTLWLHFHLVVALAYDEVEIEVVEVGEVAA